MKIDDSTLRRVTSYASVLVATVLIIAKIFAYHMTSSVALLSSLVDSGVDLLASLITAYGVFIALRPPDRDHRFGHGKAESLAALAQGVFIVISSIILVKEAAERLVLPQPVQNLDTGFAVMGFAIVMTVALLALQSYTIRRTKSLAITSDRLHYVGDVLINAAVVATFLVQKTFDVEWVDPVFALLIACGMCVGAFKISKMALHVLMDAEMPEKDRARITVLAQSVKGVLGVHDLRTRTDNGRAIIEAHVEMHSQLSLHQAHDIAEEVMEVIKKEYENADVLIHQDPAGVEEARLDTVIEQNDPTKA